MESQLLKEQEISKCYFYCNERLQNRYRNTAQSLCITNTANSGESAKTSRSSQQTQGDKKKTSVSTDISSDTAMRLERERILAMGDARVRQFGMLDKERYDYFQ